MTLLRRHGLWLVVATIVGIVGAWLFYAARPHAYLSAAQVDVEPNPTIIGTPVTPNMATEQQVATSGVIVGRTAAALGVSPESLAGHLSAKVTGTANVLSIGCTMPVPAMAQRCADAAAAAYVGFRNLPAGNNAQQAHDPLHVTLVTPATLPGAPAGPGKRILLPIGAILGLALGTGAIVLRDRFDDRVRDRADLERCLEGPVLAAVPRVRRRGVDPASVFPHAPGSRAAEAYRYLRSRLGPFMVPAWSGGTILLVAGPDGLEGRTCVAANMARALAQAGSTVLLVDADLRHPRRSGARRAHPSLSEVFRAGVRPGLTELLAGTVSLDEVARPAETPGLRFVAVGTAADRSADIFAAANLAGVFTAMKGRADVVVVDSSPVLAVADAIAMARASDLVVMVANVRRTGRGAVSAAAQEIRATGRSMVGVLNCESARANRLPSASSEREPEWLTPPGGPSARARTASGPNGQRLAPLGAMSTRSYRLAASRADDPMWSNGLTATRPDADDPPGSGAAG